MQHRISEQLKAKFIAWLMKPYSTREVPLCDFERISYEIRPCDVLLIEGQNRVSEAIKMVTQSAWSHAALYVGRLHDIEDIEVKERIKSFTQCGENEQLLIEGVLGQGTIVSPLSKYKLEHIRICRPNGISRGDAQKVIKYLANHLGTAYSIRATFDLFRLLYPWGILPRNWRSSLFQQASSTELDREICSTVIAEAFSSVKFPVLPIIKKDKVRGIEFIPRNPKLFTPRDFDYSPYFEIIKYPLFDLSEGALYKHLPWSKEGTYSDDDGEIYTVNHPSLEKPTKEKKKPKFKFRKTPKSDKIEDGKE